MITPEQQQQHQARENRSRRKRRLRDKRQIQQQNNIDFKTIIRNFRPVGGLNEEKSSIYRCGSTDALGKRIRIERNNGRAAVPLSTADAFVSKDAGLILDLRSPVERNESDAALWINDSNNDNEREPNHTHRGCHRPMRVLTIPLDYDEPNLSETKTIDQALKELMPQTELSLASTTTKTKNLFPRFVVRLDVLNRTELINYVRTEWLGEGSSFNSIHSSTTNSNTTTTSITTSRQNQLSNRVMTEINKRGLAGLNEAILETRSGKCGLCAALKCMTLYRESILALEEEGKNRSSTHNSNYGNSNDCDPKIHSSIVFHCVQGKDRTGMLAMLIQLLVGCSDETILQDYCRSNDAFRNPPKHQQPSKTKKNTNTVVRMDPVVFYGTNRSAMVATLAGMRERYGRDANEYFDAIGFDASWRRRFLAVVATKNSISNNKGSSILSRL